MNLKGITPLNIAVIIVVAALIIVVGVGVYLVNGPKLVDDISSWPWGDINGVVYDNDPTIAENYMNENVLITVCITHGYLKDVGNPNYGLIVAIGSSQRGWGPFQATTRGQTDYEKGYVENSGTWTGWGLLENSKIRWKLYVPVKADGHLENDDNAYLYLWALVNVDNEYSKKLQPNTQLLWDNGDDLMITVSSKGDSFTSPSGAVRLFGQPWTVG